MTALAPVWAQALREEGLVSRARVAVWLEAHPQPPANDVMDMLLCRVRGSARLADLAAERGVAHGPVQGLLRTAGLRLIVPHLDDVAAWARARDSGVLDGSIAALSGVLPEVVTLALDGWPARGTRRTDEAAVVSAYEMWIAGEPLPGVAQALGITPTQLRRDLAQGSASLPRRLTATDISRRFGWNPSTAHRSHQAGLLPPPDGKEDTGAWWWEHTIERWAAHRDMHPCPACASIYPTSTGLRGHLTREHPGS